jgi:2-polyprenyl-6-methoxyphenol hydroxylase-like FAD-dependent oxidoreductase
MAEPTVLISGAGIAGPTLAFWLHRNGYRVMVVELAPGIRPGGQTVDLRGVGRDVVERMGLLDQMTALALDQAGAAWVRSDGGSSGRDARHRIRRQRAGQHGRDPAR